MRDIPDVHFGNVDAPLPDWRKAALDDGPDNDEPFAVTPQEIVDLLGFDPAKEPSGA